MEKAILQDSERLHQLSLKGLDGEFFEQEIAGELFKPFFTTHPGGEGIGLGLFIARGIVRQHNGDISIENNSAPERGDTSTVLLPVRPSL